MASRKIRRRVSNTDDIPLASVPANIVDVERGDLAVNIEIVERPYVSSDEEDDQEVECEYDPMAEMPSRRVSVLGYRPATLRRRKSSQLKRRPTHIANTFRLKNKQVSDRILESWRAEDEMNSSTPAEISTNKRVDELTALPIHLSEKKRLRKELKSSTIRTVGDLSSKGLSFFTVMKYNLAIQRKHAKYSLLTAIHSLSLWDGHIKNINSTFGTDVTAFFLFLRWLFISNSLNGLLILVFLFVPQMVFQYLLDGKPYPESIDDGREFLLGKGTNSSGFFQSKGMYYGDYTNHTLSPGTPYRYDMKLAYLLTYGAYFLIYFLVIAVSVAKSYRKNFIESNDKFTFQYVLKVLDGWDYHVTGKTVGLKQRNNLQDFKEFCASNRENVEKGNCCDNLFLFLFRFGAVFIQIVIIGGCAVAVYFAADKIGSECTDDWCKDLAVPVVISAINTIFPFVFSKIASYLNFTNPKSVVYMTLIMTLILYCVTLGVYFAYTLVPCANDDVLKRFVSNSSCPQCWETRLGQKAYSLVFVDFLFGVVVTLCTEVIYRLISQFCCRPSAEDQTKKGDSVLPQFNIASNTMSLLYSQFLLWLGIYYSPLLTVVVVIKLLIIFYMKRVTVMNACVPTTKPWRAAKMHTVFLGLLLLGFLFSAVMFGVAIAIIPPSLDCGPFKGLASVSAIVTSALNGYHSKVVSIIMSPGVVVGIIVTLCIVVHYVRVMREGRKKLISLLKIQLTLESKDKAFLQHMLEKVQASKKASRQSTTPFLSDDSTDGAVQHPATEDNVAELRPLNGRKKVFAKQKSDALLNDSARTSKENLLQPGQSKKSGRGHIELSGQSQSATEPNIRTDGRTNTSISHRVHPLSEERF